MPPNKRLYCSSHLDGGISQRRENDAGTFNPGGGDARSGKVVISKLTSLNEFEPHENLNVAANSDCPAGRESA